MPDDPLLRIQQLKKKYDAKGVDTPAQTETLDIPKELQTGVLANYQPQSEESKRFEEEWNKKGAAKQFRDTQVHGWKKVAGRAKVGMADIWEFMAGSMGGLSPIGANDPEVQEIKHNIEKSAEKTFSEVPPIPDRFWPQTLSMLPQVAGTAASLLAAPATGGSTATFIPGMIGTANAAYLATSVYGGSLMECDRYAEEIGVEVDEWTRRGVAAASAALEFGLEKARLDRVLPKGMVTKMVTKKLLAEPALLDDIMKKWASKAPTKYQKLISMSETTLKNMSEEGAEEFLAEIGQSIGQNVYREKEDWLGASEIWDNAKRAYVGGAMMGGFLGPGSYASNSMYHKMRQRRNGVTIVGTEEGKAFEYIGSDGKDPNMVTVMDNKGNMSSIKRSAITSTYAMSGPELKEYLNAYRDTQEGLPEMEEQFKRNAARQQVDQVGQGIMFRGSESPDIRIGKRRGDGKMFYIRASFEDTPGQLMHVVMDPETMKPAMLHDREIETGMVQDYDTWLENETEELMGTITQAEQAQETGDQIEQALKDEAGVFELNQGEKVLYQNREFILQEKGQDGSLKLEPIDPETGELDLEEGSIELTPEQAEGVAKYIPEGAPASEAGDQTVEGAEQGETEQTETEQHPQARTIDDGKNEYQVLDGKITETYPTAKQANGIAKKLSEIYSGLTFGVHEFDDGDPFNKNEYTITVDVKQKQTEEVVTEGAVEETQPEVTESVAVEESPEIAPETAQVEVPSIEGEEVVADVTGEEVTQQLPTTEESPEVDQAEPLKSEEEIQAEALQEESANIAQSNEEQAAIDSQEDALDEIKDFQPEPVSEEVEEEADRTIEDETDQEPTGQDVSQVPASEQFAGESLKSDKEKELKAAEQEVDTNPTEEQKKAGNYKMGHLNLHGFDITIENPKGSTRSGTDQDGKKWSVTMAHTYGYFKSTKAPDGDHIDVFIGENPESEKIFVVDQVDPKTGEFDEFKVMAGFNTIEEAKAGYLANYESGWKGLGNITETSLEYFREWALNGTKKQKPFAEYKAVKGEVVKEEVRKPEFAGSRLVGKKEPPPVKEEKQDTKPKKQPTGEKIQDFGEKIGQAKKDFWADRKKKIEGITDEDLLNKPLPDVMPVPDYIDLVKTGMLTKEEAALLQYFRSKIGRKPNKNATSYKKGKWLKHANSYKELYLNLMDKDAFKEKHGASFMEMFQKGMDAGSVKEIKDYIDLINSLGFPEAFNGNLQGFEIKDFSLWERFNKDGSKKKGGGWAITKGSFIVADFDTREESIAGLKHILEGKGEQRKTVKFDVWTERGKKGYFVGKKVGTGKFIQLAGPFDTFNAAKAHVRENREEMEQQLAKKKEIPSERPDVSELKKGRIGKDYRNGKDVTPEMFTEAFRFRGVEFGNWVENDKRQADLNNAYDALMDLAEIVGIPSQAISLGGELGLAFGARGVGGKQAANAHYEPVKVVINLTKKSGAGSLAHEWFHAVDNYFSRMRDESTGYLTSKPRTKLVKGMKDGKETWVDDTSVRPEVIEAFNGVVKAIKASGIVERSRGLDQRRSKNYWSDIIEMSARSFEAYVKDKMDAQDMHNDYLVAFKDMVNYIVDSNFEEDADLYPYPTKEEQPAINEAFDNLLDVIETKQEGDGPTVLFKAEKPEFAGQTLSNHDSNIRNVTESLANELNTPIIVVEKRSELPNPIQRSIKNDKRVPGAYDVRNDKVYIVTSEVKDPKEAIDTILHEIVAHKGLRELFGSEFDQVLNDVYDSMHPREISVISRAYMTQDPLEIADEHIAHIAEGNTSQSMLDKVVAWIRKQLRKMFKIDYSKKDIIDMLNKSRRNLQKKKPNKAQFAGQHLEMETTMDRYMNRAKDSIGLRASEWIQGAFKQSPNIENVFDWLAERKAIYQDSPRIANRIRRAMNYIADNPNMGSVRMKIPHQEGEAGPPKSLLTTRGQKFRRAMQDRSIAIRELQNRIKGLGGKITEYSNPYRQENLSHGAVKSSIEDYDKQYIDPLLKTISDIQKATGMDYKQINEYMMAKHAPERNEALRKESGSDVNAGMTTKDAEALTSKYESKMAQGQVDKFWKQVTKTTRFALQRNLKDGFISKELYDKLTGPAGFKYYVPMRGWAHSEADDLFEYFQSDAGKTVNPFRSAKGRKSLADDPLQYIVNMAHTAIVMGEKNRVKQHLSSLVRNNKDLRGKDGKPLFWFKKVYYVWDGTFDADGKKNYTEHIEKPSKNLWDEGRVESKFNGDHMKRRSAASAQEHEVEVWIGGEKFTLVLPADVAAAVNKTPSSWDNSAYALQKSIGKLTRWLSANFTSKNPAFIPVNQIRDLQYAFWAHAIKGEKGDLGKFIKAIPGARGAIIRSLKDKADMSNKLDKMYRDFRLSGGETGYIHIQDVDQLAKNLSRDLKRLNRKNVPGHIVSKVYLGAGEILEHWAVRSENLSRFATYVTAIERGASPKQAAQEAKDITVNFNRKGLSAGVTGSLYAFFNAGIQGGHNAMKMAKDNPGKMAIAGAGMTAMGFLTAMFAHLWAGDEDDDSVNDYEELNDYHKYNNLTIPVPGKDKFVTIPLPHFFRFFNAVGVLAYQTIVTDEKTTGEAIANGVSSLTSSISPVNPVEFFEQGTGLGGAIRPVTPTAFVPVLDIITNTDFAGNMIRREPFTSSMQGRIANSQLGQKHVNRYLKWATDQWFKLGGGDPEAGSKFYMDRDGNLNRVNDFMDINPSNIEHVFEYLLGGRGRFWNNALKTGEGVISGATETVMSDREFREVLSDVNSNTVPIFRRFYTQPWQNSVYTRYYDIINEMEDYKSFIRAQAKLSDDVEVSDLMDPYHEYVSDELKYLSEDLKYIEEDIELISDPEQVEDLKTLQDLLIRNFLEAEKGYRESLK